MTRIRYIGVTLLAALGFTVSQHLYSREIAENEVLQNEINQLRRELVAIKERLPKQHSCPPHWTSFGPSCYLVWKEEKMHGDAAMHCIRYGSKLVEIETAEENGFIRNNLLSRFDVQVTFWTGGTDAVMEKNWIWSMTGKPISFESWRSGEPNNDDDGRREDCLEFKRLQSKTWNDAGCNYSKPFICEKNVFY